MEALDVSTAVPNDRNPSRLRFRAVIVGLLLIPLNAYWLAIVELVRNTQTPTSVSLFFNVIFTVVLVSLANAPLRRWVPAL
ncbi:MAG TPA: hypothetical protein PLQ54_06035, partial [Armatimonadota bacterium]|nr:hypothetical protein [Armatimonadota bacterium]